MQVTVCRLDVW